MAEGQIFQSHDRIFRHAFSVPLVAQQFLNTWLPKEVLSLLNWETFEIQKLSGVADSLAERREDVLYRARAAESTVFFYFLLEHQTKPLRGMPFRIYEYTGLVWQGLRGEIEAGVKLPLVIPIVVYAGESPWSQPERLSSLINVPEEIREWTTSFAPDCGFCLVSLAGIHLKQLAGGSLARAVLAALRGERAGALKFEQVRQIIVELFAEPARAEALKIANHLWCYLLYHSELQSSEVSDIVGKTIPIEEKEAFMSTAELLKQEGRQEGRQEGWQEGRVEGEVLAGRRAVLEVLEVRFGSLPSRLLREVEWITDPNRLQALHRQAISCSDLESFIRGL